MRLAFDIETNGLLPAVNIIHCINVIDIETGAEYRFNDHETYPDPYTGQDTGEPTGRSGSIADGIVMLESADEVWAHNGIGFDFPVLAKLGPADFSNVRRRDSKVCAALIWADAKERDLIQLRKGKLPEEFKKNQLVGKHSLEAWGYRLGDEKKGDFDPADYGHTWETYPFSKDCDEYCIQDVRVLVRLIKLIDSKQYSEEAIQLEHDVAEIIHRQEQYGWLFDCEAAERLTAQLQMRRAELEEECRRLYPPFYVRDGKTFTPKRDNTKRGYVAGAPLTKVKLVDFNPGSRHHIANRLIHVEGWVPTEFTSDGHVKVDEAILEGLPYDSAKKIAEYMLVEKRLGQLSEGNEAWLKHVQEDGRIHGRVNTNGAVTGRMTHFNPNIAQVPRNESPYGVECRSLFTVPAGKKLVGCDADGLEIRCMGHYLAPYDGGAFIRVILEGKKEDGTDMHTRNQKAIKFNSRTNAKTFFYALIYGAGDYKLGTIVLDDMNDEQRAKFYARYPAGPKRKSAIARLGKNRRAALIGSIAGLDKLLARLQEAGRKRGWIKGLDGRRVHVRSLHSILNTLFQSAGAIVMKKALVICDRTVAAQGLSPGINYEFVGNIHDEYQQEVDEDKAELVGQAAAESIRLAGEHFGFRCPLAGNYDIGNNWSETH